MSLQPDWQIEQWLLAGRSSRALKSWYTSGPSCTKGGERYPPDKSLSNGYRNWFP